MKNLIKKTKNFNKKCRLIYFVILSLLIQVDVIFADTLLDNQITNGIKSLASDASKLIMVLATIIAPTMVGFFQLRKKWCEDEMEAKQFDKKSKAIIVTYIVIMCLATIFSIISDYFNISTTV